MRSTIVTSAVMLSAAARAFTAIPISSRGAGMSRLLVARFMTEGGEQGKTVVDICTAKISAALETDDVKVVGAYDDPNGSHITVEVYSDKFDGKRLVQRQQLVYKALWEELDSNAVHAVDSMVCKTPAEK
mmetsp:Transcript_7353/g.16037  ORF Transcript_7353/g.16037 Transcript_7353/m.16037 type:complete len:130 (+) Transcript_7353:174-563(+)